MKRSDIKVGMTYTNGKGRFRKVLAIGSSQRFAGQKDCHCVEFYPTRVLRNGREVADTQAQDWDGGPNGHNTLKSFASWAKSTRETT